LIIRGNELEDVVISSVKINNELTLDCKLKRFELIGNPLLEFDKPQIFVSRIKFFVSNQTAKGTYLFRQANFHKLIMYGANNNTILFKNCSINNIDIRDFSNTGEFALHNINKINQIAIEDSSMGKAEFLDVELSTAAVTKLTRSNVLDVVLIDTTFSEALVTSKQDDYKGIRDAFRQLKLTSGKQGNRIQELRYEALEMGAYYKDDTSLKSRSDRFILWSNEWSNNHGQDPVRALIWLGAITLSLYSLIKLCQGDKLNFSYFFITASEYMNFALNPLHDYSKVFGLTDGPGSKPLCAGGAMVLDTLSRLLSGYLLFQFLRAFRKFVK
jgi:hypothetical protein